MFVVGFSGIPGLLQCRVPWPRDVYTDFSWGGGDVSLTLGGAVIESIAYTWGIDVKTLAKTSPLERELDVNIGTSNKRDLKERAIVIRKPGLPSTK